MKEVNVSIDKRSSQLGADSQGSDQTKQILGCYFGAAEAHNVIDSLHTGLFFMLFQLFQKIISRNIVNVLFGSRSFCRS